MGRFPWRQGQSKQSGDKGHPAAHDWFSKEHTEPSRQALTDLMKEHSEIESSNSGISPKAQTRSRTDTVTSSFSGYARSMSDNSNDLASRPPSQQSFVDGGMPSPERHESTARTLLARGTRILKRQGSKLNLLPSQIDDKSSDLAGLKFGELSPTKSLQRQPTLSSRGLHILHLAAWNITDQPTGLKRSISGPFAFQHLTHGDQARFQSLDSVSKTDLSSEFIAVQSDQRPDTQIRGIPVENLPVKTDDPITGMGLEEPASPTTDAIPYLPITPPRPQPPPKDGLKSPYSPTNFRLSRSMENFSRPTRLSVSTFDVSPTTGTTQRLSALSPSSQSTVFAKPLPHLPDRQVVHAVSTRDDIALPLPTAPLPSPPKSVMEVVKEEVTEESESSMGAQSLSQSPMFYLLPVVTTKEKKRRSQSSGEIQFSAVSFAGLLGSSSTDAAKNGEVGTSPRSKNRVSVVVKAIGLEDWDDAIDDSWDAAESQEELDVYNSTAILRQPSSLSIPHGGYLVVEQSHNEETASSASTPLMMQMPDKPFREVSAPSPPEEERQTPLLGLGIDALHSTSDIAVTGATTGDSYEAGNIYASDDAYRSRVMRSPVSMMSKRSSNDGENSFSSGDAYHSRVARSPVSMMSKSSSQESFIASIFGTHRSSNSSTSLSDFAHLTSGSFEGSMESLKLELQDFTLLPSIEKHFREGSQDTIREDTQHIKPTEALADMGIIAPLPGFTTSPTLKHDRGASASAIPSIPVRKSSIADVAGISKGPTGRRRAATATSRPRRNTRVSYSLFPTTAATN